MTTMKVFDGTAWQTASLPAGTNATTFVGPEAPPGPLKLGDLWYDTDDVPAPVITLPVSIVNGGTGASTAAQARTNLGIPGGELAYDETPTPASITATTAPTANVIITGSPVVLDGSPVLFTFFSAQVQTPTGGNLKWNLWDGATDLGYLGQVINGATGIITVPCLSQRRLAPTAGSHTFSVRAFLAAAGTGGFGAGAGGLNLLPPIYLRITKA